MVIKCKLRVNKMQIPEIEAPVIQGGRVFSPEACIIRQWIDEGCMVDRYKCYLTDELCFCESIGCYWLEGAIDKQTKRTANSGSERTEVHESD